MATAPGSSVDQAQRDFFISYTAADREWAEWIAWQLEEAGYTTILQVWDFAAGSHFVTEMHRATQVAQRTIAVLSNAYLESAFAEAEWQEAWRADPTGVEVSSWYSVSKAVRGLAYSGNWFLKICSAWMKKPQGRVCWLP